MTDLSVFLFNLLVFNNCVIFRSSKHKIVYNKISGEINESLNSSFVVFDNSKTLTSSSERKTLIFLPRTLGILVISLSTKFVRFDFSNWQFSIISSIKLSESLKILKTKCSTEIC